MCLLDRDMDQPPLFQTKTLSSALIFTEASGYCSLCTQNIAPPLIIPRRPRRPTERTLSAHIYAISLSAHTLTVAFGSWNLIFLHSFECSKSNSATFLNSVYFL